MNLSEVKKIHAKAKREAEKAVKGIYAKYNQKIIDEIANQIPKRLKLGSVNGSAQLMKDNELMGKIYIPSDNSYILNLTNPGKEELLAGSFKPLVAAERTTIVSMPYLCPVSVPWGEEIIEKLFINVSFEGQHYRVLFYPHCIEN